MSAVESVWAGAERFRLEQAVAEGRVNAELPAGLTMPSRSAGQEAGELALLLSMPEGAPGAWIRTTASTGSAIRRSSAR